MSSRRQMVLSLSLLCGLLVSVLATFPPPVVAQAGATPESREGNPLFVAEGVSTRVLGRVDADALAIEGARLLLERLSFGQNVTLPERVTISPEVLYVESGTVSIEDGFGFATETEAGESLTVNAGASYALANAGVQDVVVYRIRVAGTGAETAASPSATPVAGRIEARVLIDREIAADELSTEGISLFIADATFAPGSESGEQAHSGPLGIYVRSGTLSVLSPSGVVGKLKEDAGVVLPAAAPLVASNPSDADASVLLVGIAGAGAPLMAEVTPAPRPTIEPTPTTEPTQTPIPTPTIAPSPTAAPTNTPIPTPTPEPTNTPEPTPSPTPDAEIQGLQETLDGYFAAWQACNAEGMLLYVADFVIWIQDTDSGPNVSERTINGIDDLAKELRKNCSGGEDYDIYYAYDVTSMSHSGQIGTISFTWFRELGWTDDTGRYRCNVVEGKTSWRLEQQRDSRWLITDRSHSQQDVRRSCQHVGAVQSDTRTAKSTGHAEARPADVLAMLPSAGEIPDGLSLLDKRMRTLEEATANYSNADNAVAQFRAWGWRANAICSFGPIPASAWEVGKLNGVYVSIHAFDSPDHAVAALDFSLIEQAAGSPLQEVATQTYGDSTRALYGLLDYGYETTLLVQRGELLIRVSAASVGADPTPQAAAILERILAR